MKRVGILRFPGTNCDRDVWSALEQKGCEPTWLWHKDRFNFKDYHAFLVPGGFSYGDYLRSGALAALSPVMSSLKEAGAKGYPIFGICNGFQILCEAELLPGVLMANSHGKFMDKWTTLKLANKAKWSPFASDINYRMPLAHADGRYYIDDNGLKKLQDNGQIWLTYMENPNGSLADIAGVMNEGRNVVAMMPHPDRAMHEFNGSVDGQLFFDWEGVVQ